MNLKSYWRFALWALFLTVLARLCHNPLWLAGLPVGLPGAGGVLQQSSLQALLNYIGASYTALVIAGATVLTAAQTFTSSENYLALGGAPGAGFNVTTPSALQLLTQIQNQLGLPPAVGFSWEVTFNNSSGQTATLVGGTGVTVNGTNTTATATSRTYLFTVTNNNLNASAAITVQELASGTN